MRSQLDGQQLRLRLGWHEFSEWLNLGQLRSRTHFLELFAITIELNLVAAEQAGLRGDATHWQFDLPREPVLQWAGRLPCRDGLNFQLPTRDQDPSLGLQLLLDVDIHDRDARPRLRSRPDGSGQVATDVT